MYSFRDMLRWFHGGEAKKKPSFATEKEAYDFCRTLYNKSGGVTPELRRSYEFYLKNLDDGCERFIGPQELGYPAHGVPGVHKDLSFRRTGT